MDSLKTKESPFTPGKPVPVEYFIARLNEIERLERFITQSASGRNENVFITGERGIGKSSFAAYIRYVAQKDHNFIGAHCSLGTAKSVQEVCKLVFLRILQELPEKGLLEKVKGIFGKYIKTIDLLGINIELTADKNELNDLKLNFVSILRGLLDTIKDNKKGLVLILDDLNGITSNPDFASFIKSIVDEIATSQKQLPLLLVLIGIPERQQDLINCQPSVARIFTTIELTPMSKDETNGFFTTMFGKQNITVSRDAMSLMTVLSGGLPTLMHEIGDAAFWANTDGEINETDAIRGVSDAADNVGKKYLEPRVYQATKSPTFHSILRKLGELPLGNGFIRKDFIGKLDPSEKSNLDNVIHKMKEVGVLVEGEKRGETRFANQLYHLYVGLEKFRAEKQKSK